MNFNTVADFESRVSSFFGSPYAIATDSCTHGLELCLRYVNPSKPISIPRHTYISIPFLAIKLNIPWCWKDEEWVDYYELGDTGIYDAAVLWRKDSYAPNTLMCLSFQFQKHLSLGRGGMILTDNEETKNILKRMSYDGREPDKPWREQNINTVGYHYYMTPETARLGLRKMPTAINKKPRQWISSDWPDLKEMDVFKKDNTENRCR